MLGAAETTYRISNASDGDDGVALGVTKWADATRSPRCAVAILHGIGLNGAPYRVLGIPLTRDGAAVYALDLRGHGRSGGRPGNLPGRGALLSDIEALVSHIRVDSPGIPIVLLGESMGALFAVMYASRHPAALQGLVLLAPGLEVNGHNIEMKDRVNLAAHLLTKPLQPYLSLIDDRLDRSSQDAAFIAERRTNPLATDSVSAAYVLRLYSFAFAWRQRYPARIAAPTLVIQGGKDQLLVPAEAKRLFDAIPVSDKQFVLVESAWHTLLWDPDSQYVIETVASWICRHFPG